MSKKHKHKSKKGAGVPKTVSTQAPALVKTGHGSTALHEKCWHSHPILQLGGGVFHGASCIHPHNGYDIYVGLDWGMHRRVVYPWHTIPENAAVEVYFPIKDGSVPDNLKEFRAMVTWLSEQLSNGRKVHAGCIGGHGRTGLLLAAMVKEINGDAAAGEWVRTHYCTQAIETSEQVHWLHKHFGIAKIEPSRKSWGYQSWGYKDDANVPALVRYTPVSGRSIWGSLASRIA